jgi:uncharacterized protein (TIGR03905 family)
MEKITYVPDKSVCTKEITIELDKDKAIQKVAFIGGCPGNTMGLSALLVGMKPEKAIHLLEGIRCRTLDTSCPDQLAQAIKKLL